MTDLGFENQDIAAQVALFKNGFQDLQGAINNNALDAVVNDFVKQGKEIGLTSEEIVTKAALMKNGFSDIQQAVASGDVSGLVKDLSSLGGDLGLSTEQVDALAHSLDYCLRINILKLTQAGMCLLSRTQKMLSRK